MAVSVQVAAERMLSEARDDVKHADQKASVLLAALGIGFSVVVGGQLSSGWDSGSLSAGAQMVFWTGVLFAVASVGACGLAVWPRYQLDDSPMFGVTYWGHVAAFKRLSELEKALVDQDMDDQRRVPHQLWRVSKLVLQKYRYVRLSLVLGAIAGVLLGLATVVIR